jgi:hypothetical protein
VDPTLYRTPHRRLGDTVSRKPPRATYPVVIGGEEGQNVKHRVPVSLELLRQEARDELDAVVEYRCRLGDDPWDFMPELPTVDEHVVHTLRAQTVDAHGLAEEQAKAHHPSATPDRTAAFEYGLLRQIALDHPQLTPAVWRMLGRINAA